MADRDFNDFIIRVKQRTGIDLSLYKEKQMKRRLTSLRNLRGYQTFKDYFEAMIRNEQLFDEFIDRITINVSEFWRNPQRWEELRQIFIPRLLADNPRLKCWSAACSSGDEPYSLAMLLAEQRALQQSSILATDIDERILNIAKSGVYAERSLRELPAGFINTYFTEQDSKTYVIKDELKRRIKFAKHNLLLDPFDSNYDLIICRNVMIYFTDEAKVGLYHKFAQSLKPGGILFVGSTEQIFSPERYGLKTVATFFYEKI